MTTPKRCEYQVDFGADILRCTKLAVKGTRWCKAHRPSGGLRKSNAPCGLCGGLGFESEDTDSLSSYTWECRDCGGSGVRLEIDRRNPR